MQFVISKPIYNKHIQIMAGTDHRIINRLNIGSLSLFGHT